MKKILIYFSLFRQDQSMAIHIQYQPKIYRHKPKSPRMLTQKVAGRIAQNVSWARTYMISHHSPASQNVYGPRQNTADSASVIQTAMEKHKDEPFHLIWDTTNTRDYIHVDDVISAFMMSMNKRVGGTFNIGTGVETSQWITFWWW